MARILFIYPNVGNSLRIPLGISILSACLKGNNHDVCIFDPTFMRIDFVNDYKLMESRGVVKETDFEKIIGKIEEKNIHEELVKTIESFDPDFVAISLIEKNYLMFKELSRVVKKTRPYIPVVVGGILPTIYPNILLNEPNVDYICVGEGEKFIVDFANNINNIEKLKKIPNLWFKEGDKVVKNELGPLTSLNGIPNQDWSGFDKRQLLRAFEGKIYVAGSFELSRGCYKLCSFCVAPQLREVYSDHAPKYHRIRNPELVIHDIVAKKKEYGLEINSFCDTDFLSGVPADLLQDFCNLYKSKVGLPFLIQTSPESITENKLKMIVDAGCVTMSIGVESGSTRIRNEILRKRTSLQRVKKAFNLCRKYHVRTTANYMVGLPYETEDDAFATLEFNRELQPPSIAITYFQPFLGTESYDICVKEGFYSGFDPDISVYRGSPLNMPQFPPEKILNFVEKFTEDFNSWKSDGFGPLDNS